MYKLKYKKYKDKYLKLKETFNGGALLKDILYGFNDLAHFDRWYYNKITPEGKNSYQILLELFTRNQLLEFEVEPFNILVGTTNLEDNDYNRFERSDTYSLYIDTSVSRESARQYNMYTVNFDDISPNILSFPANSVNQIHFDTQVSYFCPIVYLDFAEHVLIIGGKIIFDLAQHLEILHMYSRRENYFYSNTRKTKTDLEAEYNVTIDVDQRTISASINHLDIYGNGNIDPQLQLTIVENIDGKFIPFYKDPYRGYVDYCSRKYGHLRFEEKTYTFSNYTYPVPIRTMNENLEINLFNITLHFIVNKVMTLDERRDYINNKTISPNLTSDIILRIIENNDMKLEFYTHVREFTEILETNGIDTTKLIDEQIGLSNDIINQFIRNELNKPFKYIEGTKI